jgi:ubiquitin-activating enzyme E1
MDELNSRTILATNKEIFKALTNTSLCIINGNYNSLSQEILKNAVLLNIKKITLNFNILPLKTSNLYFNNLNEFRNLNSLVEINDLDIETIISNIPKKIYDIVIVINTSLKLTNKINKIARENNIYFIYTSCYGLLGTIFNDLGNEYNILNTEGIEHKKLIIKEINSNIITCVDEHEIYDNDILIINYKNNNEEQLTAKKISPLKIQINKIIKLEEINYIIKKNNTTSFKYLNFEDSLLFPEYENYDFSIEYAFKEALHQLLISCDKYIEEQGTIMRPWSDADLLLFKQYSSSFDELNVNYSAIGIKFCYTASGEILAFNSIIGGMVAHEIIKIMSKNNIPIKQWIHIEYFKLIKLNEIINLKNKKNKYESLINIFGNDVLKQIQNTKPFVVGSGAIGCELMKHLSNLGTNTINITDNDNIEKSNLSRQFLFGNNDIGKSKSIVASEKVKQFNEDININTYELKVCRETENTFNKQFHSNIDIYLNALDNVEARKYMDRMAIYYEKPLIDSGTSGAMANIQIVIPNLTISYSSLTDMPEKTIPMCTIKSFPYKTEHTIQWARELFEEEFNIIPSLIIKNNLTDIECQSLFKKIYKYKFITLNKNENTFNQIISNIIYENYIYNIKNLMKNINREEINKTDKNLPNEYKLNELEMIISDELITSFYNILNKMFNTNIVIDKTEKFKLICNEYDLENINYSLNEFTEIKNNLLDIINIDFDKNVSEHIKIITEISNLRNTQYNIEKTTYENTYFTTGKIIPALITTTSVIAGYQILEYINLIINKNSMDINDFTNRELNLNINYNGGNSPIEVKKHIFTNILKITLWNKIYIKTTNVNEIIKYVENLYNKEIRMITNGNKTLYDSYNPNKILCDVINIDEHIELIYDDIDIAIPLIYN